MVICPRGRERDTEPHVVLDGVEIRRYPLDAATGGPFGYIAEYSAALSHTARIAFRLDRRAPFDVVHICNPPDLLFLCGLPLKARGARIVFDQHDLGPELFRSRFGERHRALYAAVRLLERATYRTADAVIATNESYRRIALSRGKVPAERVTVVRSAPDRSRFPPTPPERDLLRGKRHLVCYLGVMGPQDGVDCALRALAHLRHGLGRDDVRAVFIGSGDVYPEMVNLSRMLGLEAMVEFTGRISDTDVRRHLATADVCLAPDPMNPLNDISTMNKIVEYMAMGRPIVSFDLAEARVSAGEAALYATPNDEKEFAELVAALLEDPGRRAYMGEVGRARVEGELSWDHSKQQLIAAYERLLARPGRRRRHSGGP